MTMSDTSKLIALPTDDELLTSFMYAAENGVHEGLKNTVRGMAGYVGNAKEDLKMLLKLDPATGLSLDFDKAKAGTLMNEFIAKQNFLVRNALKLMLIPFGADTFDHFVERTKQNGQEGIDLVVNNITKIFVLWFQTLGQTYQVSETEESIKAKVVAAVA